MPVHVRFDDRLREKLDGTPGVDIDAATVHEALVGVATFYPSFRMFNCDGELRSFLRLSRDGEPISVATPLEDGDVIELAMGI